MPKPSESSTKFIERNRAPRVHISYDLDINGAQRKVELPFVVGVMADLSGKLEEGRSLPPIQDRKFSEVSVDNFDGFMKDIKPRVAFQVPNVLGDKGGNIQVDIKFEKMADFSPDAIVRQVEPLRELLDVRTKLNNLLSFMDGKAQAEDLIKKLIDDKAYTESLPAAAKQPEEG